MKTSNILKAGAGTTIIAAILTGILSNGAVKEAGGGGSEKIQDRLPYVSESVTFERGDEPLVSPAFENGRNTIVVEMVPAN